MRSKRNTWGETMNTTDIVNSLRVEASMLFNQTYALTMTQAADKLEELERHIAELKEKNAGLALACLLECPPNEDLRRGTWIEEADGTHSCSNCGHDATYTFDGTEICGVTCPFCGSIMEVEDG